MSKLRDGQTSSSHKKRNSGKLTQIETSDEKEKKLWSKYLFKKIIGKGGFSIVIALHEKSTAKTIAAKVVEKHKISVNTLNLLRCEPNILKELSHNCIIRMIDFIESKKRMFMLVEYMRGGDLSKYIKNRSRTGQYFREGEVAIIMKKIFKGLCYLHSKSIVHRDIKPGNILIETPNYLDTIRIADFGLSFKMKSSRETRMKKCGTLNYMAPEIIQDFVEIGPAVDLWASGIVLAMLLNRGKHPFVLKGEPEHETKRKIASRETRLELVKASSDAKDLLSNLLASADKRISAVEALNHPFITKRTYKITGEQLVKVFNTESKLSLVFGQLIVYINVLKQIRPNYYQKQRSLTKGQSLLRNNLFSSQTDPASPSFNEIRELMPKHPRTKTDLYGALLLKELDQNPYKSTGINLYTSTSKQSNLVDSLISQDPYHKGKPKGMMKTQDHFRRRNEYVVENDKRDFLIQSESKQRSTEFSKAKNEVNNTLLKPNFRLTQNNGFGKRGRPRIRRDHANERISAPVERDESSFKQRQFELNNRLSRGKSGGYRQTRDRWRITAKEKGNDRVISAASEDKRNSGMRPGTCTETKSPPETILGLSYKTRTSYNTNFRFEPQVKRLNFEIPAKVYNKEYGTSGNNEFAKRDRSTSKKHRNYRKSEGRGQIKANFGFN